MRVLGKTLLCLFLAAAAARAQAPALTTVKDTGYRGGSGALASGTLTITWPPFTSADSRPILGGSVSSTVTSGVVAVSVVPNAGATPSGTSYSVRFFETGATAYQQEYWVVPASTPLANPAIPVSVTQTGTPGSTTYYYWCTGTNASGETLLSPARVTTTSNATLSGTNYNVITCATVTSATGYKAYRTTTSTAPTGTGLYLVGSAAGTVINDQSNTLTSATIPSVNDTDPETLAAVRVSAAPSPAVIFNASQVSGTAIVANPTATQTITAPASSGTPLIVKGRSGNASDVFQLFDNTGTPKQTLGVTSAGQLYAEGATENGFEGFVVFTDPTADRNWTFPNADATLIQPDAGASNNFLTAVSALGVISKAQPAFTNLSGAATLAQLPFGTANQILGTNSGATAQEHKTLAVGTAGTDFAIAHAANLVTFNLPDASATARGAMTTGAQTFAGNKIFNGSLAVGAGTAITKHLSATATLDFANQAAIGCNDLTITVTGAAVGNSVEIGVPNGSVPSATSYFTAWVSATDTVTVRFCALISGDPASGTFRADVWQH